MVHLVEITLTDEEYAALQRFMAQHPRPYSDTQAVRLLVRDALTAMGDLPLPRSNRSKWAGR